jgi:8-oxo-dGTP diphosphatase
VPWAIELSESRASAVIDVIVGIVRNHAGDILIGLRPEGTHMAGSWEFPGGKLNSGEAPLAGLKRELAEELGITVESAEAFVVREFEYPDRHVRLDVWWVLAYRGTPEPGEGQTLRWVDAAELDDASLLPADAPVVALIRERLASEAQQSDREKATSSTT